MWGGRIKTLDVDRFWFNGSAAPASVAANKPRLAIQALNIRCTLLIAALFFASIPSAIRLTRITRPPCQVAIVWVQLANRAVRCALPLTTNCQAAGVTHGYNGCSITGIFVYPCTKFDGTRSTSPTTSTMWKRFWISSQSIRSCNSASRFPMQRCGPNPKEMLARFRSIINSLGFSIARSSRLPERYHMMTLSPCLMV